MSCVSGDKEGGLWAVTTDLTVVCRDTEAGGWVGGLGKMRLVSVGGESVWAVNIADEVFVRTGLSPEDPRGREWTKIEGAMAVVSVGPTGVCWAVDRNQTVWRRAMAK